MTDLHDLDESIPEEKFYFYEGALWLRTPGGDTLLPPWSGQYNFLERVASEQEAIPAALEWVKQGVLN